MLIALLLLSAPCIFYSSIVLVHKYEALLAEEKELENGVMIQKKREKKEMLSLQNNNHQNPPFSPPDQQQLQQQPNIDLATDDTPADPNNPLIYHFIVSSDCTTFQKWQVLTQIHSAIAVQQHGKFTWIVSGCSSSGKETIQHGKTVLTPDLIQDELNHHFPPEKEEEEKNEEQKIGIIHPKVHFTPDYSDMSIYGGPYANNDNKKRYYTNPNTKKTTYSSYGNIYKFNNKPNSLLHWAKWYIGEEKKKQNQNNEAIVLIDPDFLFLTPFQLPDGIEKPAPRKPLAAKYGLGIQWKTEFNTTAICGPESRCNTISNDNARRYYSAGPPYIIHLSDVLPLATYWVKFVPPTYDQYPLLYAEMYAYSMAAVHIHLPHTLVNGIFTGCMVGWPGVKKGGEEMDALVKSSNEYKALVVKEEEEEGGGSDNVIKGGGVGSASSCFGPPLKPPPFLHYCARYTFTSTPTTVSQNPPPLQQKDEVNFCFAKRRVPHEILNCTSHPKPFTPWKTTPEDNQIGNGRGSNGVEWNVLSTCAVVRAVNYARAQGGIGCGKSGV